MIDNLTDLYIYYNELNYILSYGIDAHFDEDIYNKLLGKKRTSDVKNVYSLIEEYYKVANTKKNKVSLNKNSKREIDAVINYEENDSWTNYIYTWYGISKNYTKGSVLPRIDTFELYEKVLDIIMSKELDKLYDNTIEEKIKMLVDFALEDYHATNNRMTKNNENRISIFIKECLNKELLKYSGGKLSFHQNILYKIQNESILESVYEIADIFSNASSLSPFGYFLKRNILNFFKHTLRQEELNQKYMKIKGNSIYFSFCNELIYRSLYAVSNGRYVIIDKTEYIVKKIILKRDGMFGISEYPLLIAYNIQTAEIEEIELNEQYLEVGDKYKENVSSLKNKMIDDGNEYLHRKLEDCVKFDVYFYIQQDKDSYIKKRIENSNWQLEVIKVESKQEKYDVYAKKNIECDKVHYKACINKKEENDFVKWMNSFGDYGGYKKDIDKNYTFTNADKKISVRKRENSEFDKSLFSPLYSMCMDEYRKQHNLFIPTNMEIYWLDNIIRENKTMCQMIMGERNCEKLVDIIAEYISESNTESFNPFKCINIDGERVLDINERIEFTLDEEKTIPDLIHIIKNKYIMEYEYSIKEKKEKGVIYPYRIEIDLINKSKGLMAYDLINEKTVYIKLSNLSNFTGVKYYESIDNWYEEKAYQKEEKFLKEIYYFNNMACRRDDSKNVIELLSLFKTFDIDKKTKEQEINLTYALSKKSMNKFVNDYYSLLSSKRKEILALQENEEILVNELTKTYKEIMCEDKYNNCEYIECFRKEIYAKYNYYYRYVKEESTHYSVTPKEIRFAITSIKMYQNIYEYLIGYNTKGKKISDRKIKLCNRIFADKYNDVFKEEILLRNEKLKPITAKIRIKLNLTIPIANRIRNDFREFAMKIMPDENEESFIIELEYESFKFRKIHMILLSWGDDIEVIAPLDLKEVLNLRKI